MTIWLWVVSFFFRELIVNDPSHIKWPLDTFKRTTSGVDRRIVFDLICGLKGIEWTIPYFLYFYHTFFHLNRLVRLKFFLLNHFLSFEQTGTTEIFPNNHCIFTEETGFVEFPFQPFFSFYLKIKMDKFIQIKVFIELNWEYFVLHFF